MRLSIVTTLYWSAATVNEFHRRVMAAAEPLADEIELIFVNDGSPDESLDLALALQRTDSRVVVVDLSRNFGHHRAMMTGLAHASGELVFLIDSDLEEEPELLRRFYEILAHNDIDVVYGIQKRRRGSFTERFVGEIFIHLLEMLSDYPFPRNVVTVRLMRRDYVRALVRHRDREFLIAQLWQVSGFRQVPETIEKLSNSLTTYSFRRRISMAIKYLTTTSTRLLYMIFFLGIGIFGLSSLVILYFLSRYFFTGIGVDGFTSVIVSIWLFGGLTTLILGILGIYIANIFTETKRRPYTIVRQIYRAQNVGIEAAPNIIAAASRGAVKDRGAVA